MAYGDIVEAYSDKVKSLGYNENSQIDQDDYAPNSTAHKSYYVQIVNKTGEHYSGNQEETDLEMVLTVVFWYPRSLSYSDNEKTNWNLIDTLERDLLEFAAERGDVLTFQGIEAERAEDYKVVKVSFTVKYFRSIDADVEA